MNISSYEQEDIDEEKWDLLNPEIISRRATINIGVIGQAGCGKSTL
ncbi:hypothetical protein Pint_03770 [Pistacia integerrima]|uniref:Uncharacterized protein n=1 Tax=Pistacia integerrima TaxID=434235 RepID=A0ACC0Z3D4_9ROSI|nr:hypothetical protein Pint_03770 [Pistacia integerrima]